MTHDHDDAPPHGHHHHAPSSQRRLIAALALTLSFAGVEAVAGWWSGSLALLGDAGHMLTDSLALGLAAAASMLANRPPSKRHSYGLGRTEILAALANALVMLLLVALISAEAVKRLQEPVAVQGLAVIGVAAIGLGVNLVAAWLLAGGRDNLNVRAALLHVMGDLLGSVAALVSGVVILYTDWTTIDPILSLIIVGLILFSSLRVLREALHALMEGVPPQFDLAEVGRALAAVEGVESVHDLHIWSLSASHSALSAHVVLRDAADWPEILDALEALLRERFRIEHFTLQPESQTRRIGLERLGLGGESD